MTPEMLMNNLGAGRAHLGGALKWTRWTGPLGGRDKKKNVKCVLFLFVVDLPSEVLKMMKTG